MTNGMLKQMLSCKGIVLVPAKPVYRYSPNLNTCHEHPFELKLEVFRIVFGLDFIHICHFQVALYVEHKADMIE
jgi:hypothetical protein